MLKRNILTGLMIVGITTVGNITASTVVLAKECGGAQTAIIECGNKTGQEAILEIIKQVIRVLTFGIGIVAVGAVAFGGILYSSSGDNPENLKKAKDIWMNVAIGLLIYTFLVAITNFLIPGGVFG